ncbi:isoaspartyl peptidase/L-asparaginase [Candidatus Bipolaricaulota bacterium]|nr:isoaspartyl peptidase/L-asparaginase [Candidatus Bipolaricaulota bacterium]
MIIIVHGGAGKIPEEDLEDRKSVLTEAATQGLEKDDPLKAVEKAVRILENDPLFNAGYGGSLQLDGKARLDAAIMRSDLSAGGVINVEGIKNPITLANGVRRKTPHVLLQGEGALELARNLDLEMADETRSPKARKKWEDLMNDLSGLSYLEKLEKLAESKEGHDTVGAVALEGEVLAAGTSTGGVSTQMKGRVGDSPIIGSGLYCNEHGAVSTTGIGEAIIKVNLARELVYRIEGGLNVQEAAETAISRLDRSTGSRAGLIVLDSKGEVGTAYNTRDMQYVVKEDSGLA